MTKQQKNIIDEYIINYQDAENKLSNLDNLLDLYFDNSKLYNNTIKEIKIEKYKLDFYEKAINKCKNEKIITLNELSKMNPLELKNEINHLATNLKAEKETLIHLKTIPLQNDDLDMIHYTEHNIENLENKLILTHKTLVDYKNQLAKSIDMNEELFSNIEIEQFIIDDNDELLESHNQIQHYIDESNKLYQQYGFYNLDFNSNVIMDDEKANKIPFDQQDLDSDGLTNSEEFNLGTSIYSSDTDGNGIDDINDFISENYRISEKLNKNQEQVFFIEQKRKLNNSWRKLKPKGRFKNVESKNKKILIQTIKDLDKSKLVKSKSKKI